jgi:hypothetical protein
MKNNVFSRTRVSSCWNLIVSLEIDKNEEKPIENGVGAQSKIGEITNNTKSKILTHFLKGKKSFTPLETISTIPNELKYLKRLVKLSRKHKDEETKQVTHITTVLIVPTIKWIGININHIGKTLHLTIEVHNSLIEGLVDTSASMLVMVCSGIKDYAFGVRKWEL